MGRNQAAAVLVDRMFQFRCDLVQTVGDDPTFLQRQMQGFVGLVGKELIVPDLLPERRAPDQIGMEQQALRGFTPEGLFRPTIWPGASATTVPS